LWLKSIMPFGYFTIEQYKQPAGKARGAWTPVIQLDAGHNLTDALKSLEARKKPGLYRVLQIQRCIWAETKQGKLKLYPAHASNPGSLDKITEIFIREKGHRPTAKARADRKKAKAKSTK
jgi:hypothetical protein